MKTSDYKLSRRQVTLQYGLNDCHVQSLLKWGYLSHVEEDKNRKQPRIDRADVESLREGVHYVMCLECGEDGANDW